MIYTFLADLLTSFRGELAALTAAFLWATVSLVYVRLGRQISPLALNFSKGMVAIACLLITILGIDPTLSELTALANQEAAPVWLLLASGVVGIGVGDTAFFAALNQIGARRTIMLEALAPPLTALMALVFLSEVLKPGDWLGILLVVAGVTWVVSERLSAAAHQLSQNQPQNMGQAQVWRGISFGLIAAWGQALGAVMSRSALTQAHISPLVSTLLRLIAGTVVLFLLMLVRRQVGKWLTAIARPKTLGLVCVSAFFSTYLGIWLQQTALKYTAAGIAQTLGATSPIFILPIVVMLGEKISDRAVLGAIVALVGISLLFVG
jgi:drug/metabolite transporter (DMT)-like permease